MKLNKYIDHTILKADATGEDIKKICEQAKQYGFYSVCVNSSHVKEAKEYLNGSDVKVCSVVGFPLGQMSTEAKAFEAKDAISNGASEIDMVINISYLKDRNYEKLTEDIRRVREVTRGNILKVIIETCLLTDDEKRKVCEIADELGCDFVKTSTGFSTSGAKEEDVKLMNESVKNAKVKASGGISCKKDALRMIDAGAKRLGLSKSIQIVEEN